MTEETIKYLGIRTNSANQQVAVLHFGHSYRPVNASAEIVVQAIRNRVMPIPQALYDAIEDLNNPNRPDVLICSVGVSNG